MQTIRLCTKATVEGVGIVEGGGTAQGIGTVQVVDTVEVVGTEHVVQSLEAHMQDGRMCLQEVLAAIRSQCYSQTAGYPLNCSQKSQIGSSVSLMDRLDHMCHLQHCDMPRHPQLHIRVMVAHGHEQQFVRLRVHAQSLGRRKRAWCHMHQLQDSLMPTHARSWGRKSSPLNHLEVLLHSDFPHPWPWIFSVSRDKTAMQ